MMTGTQDHKWYDQVNTLIEINKEMSDRKDQNSIQNIEVWSILQSIICLTNHIINKT